MSILAIAGLGWGHFAFLPSKANNFVAEGSRYWRQQKSMVRNSCSVFTRFLLLVVRATGTDLGVNISICVSGDSTRSDRAALHNLGIMGRLMAEVTKSDERPLRSLLALGASGSQSFLYAYPAPCPLVAYIPTAGKSALQR